MWYNGSVRKFLDDKGVDPGVKAAIEARMKEVANEDGCFSGMEIYSVLDDAALTAAFLAAWESGSLLTTLPQALTSSPDRELQVIAELHTSDKPPCDTCGTTMVRLGDGHKCPNCGTTQGVIISSTIGDNPWCTACETHTVRTGADTGWECPVCHTYLHDSH